MTELLVAIALLGFTMAVISNLTVMSTISSIKIQNNAEGLEGARFALNRISKDIRHAYRVGLGTSQQISTPAGGFPAAPWNPNLTLSKTVLVLQIPIFNELSNSADPYDGMPLMMPANISGSSPPTNSANFDIVIYQLVEDPLQSGLYSLQMVRYPGHRLSSITGGINPPQTILKNVLGPKEKGTPRPEIFRYWPSGDNPRSVSVDLEILQTQSKLTQKTSTNSQIIGVHCEEFLRANKNMSMNNVGP